MNQPPRKRLIFWVIALALTAYLSHASWRLRDEAENHRAFSVVWQPSFSELVLYAFRLVGPGQWTGCINGLRQIDGAKAQWAMEKNKKAGDTVTWRDLLPYLKAQKRIWCPEGGAYTIGAVGEDPKCTIQEHALPK